MAGLDDVIKSKEAARASQDLDALPELIHIAEHDHHRGHDLDYGLDL